MCIFFPLYFLGAIYIAPSLLCVFLGFLINRTKTGPGGKINLGDCLLPIFNWLFSLVLLADILVMLGNKINRSSFGKSFRNEK